MNSTETVNAGQSDHQPRHRHRSQAEAERCPLCGSPITAATRSRLDEKLRTQLTKAQQTLRDQFTRQQAVAEQKAKTAIEAARRDAAKAAQAQIKAFQAGQEALIKERVEATREGFEKKITEAVAAERTRAYAERQRLDAQLQDLQRKLQKKTANDLGDEGELDLYSELTREFPMDQIERIKKGVEGGDIRISVVHNGTACGTILIESKNTSRFMNKYVAKLRADQLREKADHAILVTRAFPAGCEQLTVQNDIVIVAPQRLLVLMGLLRRQVISIHSARLSQEDRAEKAAAIYRFIASDTFRQMLDQIGQLTNELTAVDRSEVVAHQRVWTRRAELVRAVQKANQDIATEIEAIIGTGAALAPVELAAK